MADPDGIVDGFFSRVFGRSWKTTLAGLGAFVCGVAPLIPGIPSIVLDICRVALPALTGTGLMLAKDRSVSGPPR